MFKMFMIKIIMMKMMMRAIMTMMMITCCTAGSMGLLRLYWALCIINWDSVHRIPGCQGVSQWYDSSTISPLRKDADSTIMNPMKTKSVLL